MIFKETLLQGAYIVDPELVCDGRGFFARTFCKNDFTAYGLCGEFVQYSVSFNTRKWTLRGMHYQRTPYAEAKLIRCTAGSIYDVIIDLRPESMTFKQWISVELSANNRTMLYVPKHFAHGFLTLEADTEVEYHISDFYVPANTAGIRFDDPIFAIKWPRRPSVISDRDKTFPWFEQKVLDSLPN